MTKHLWLLALALGLAFWPMQIQSLISQNSDGELRLYNTHTQQTLQIRYLDETGQPISESLQKINDFLRCHVSGKSHEIDIKLLKTLDQVQDHFGKDKTLIVISGYRSPELNAHLKATGHRVATNSQHLFGKACDFKIEGVALSEIRDFALKIKSGGVGYYPGLWVHLDSAGFRTW